jgi:hypothetical protein
MAPTIIVLNVAVTVVEAVGQMFTHFLFTGKPLASGIIIDS